MTTNLIILGSARENSTTRRALDEICPVRIDKIIALNDLNIAPYDYDHSKNAGDDFLEVAKEMQQAEVIVFATPVYWYAMSGLMKNFFDRLTELLTTYRPIGKSLADKNVYLIATGSDASLPEGFEVPFRLTAKYFNMNYLGARYLQKK